MVEIIVIKYNLRELEDACIKAVQDNTDVAYHLRIFDNFPKNENLGALWNRLISESDADYICLLNSDTKVHPRWLSIMLDGFHTHEKVRIVGPSTNNCQTKQKVGASVTGVNEIVSELSGFCYLFPKSHWKELGGFREDFPFYGQESEFSLRTILAGYKLCWTPNAFVWHLGSASVKAAEERGELNMEEERRKGLKKYWEIARKSLEGRRMAGESGTDDTSRSS
jgi:cellulose synthase/poly-beta-1,6-N-acetylglucosamine synthase-like glycosyltransferase